MAPSAAHPRGWSGETVPTIRESVCIVVRVSGVAGCTASVDSSICPHSLRPLSCRFVRAQCAVEAYPSSVGVVPRGGGVRSEGPVIGFGKACPSDYLVRLGGTGCDPGLREWWAPIEGLS